MLKQVIFLFFLLQQLLVSAQIKWINVDSNFRPLPKNFHVFKTTDSLDGKPFIAFYAESDLKDEKLQFTTDSTYKRRSTPKEFYQKNNFPLLVVNGTFFSYSTSQNLNVLIKDGKLLGYNIHSYAGRGKDTFTYRHPFPSALGITKKRNADVAWLYTDSSSKTIFALQHAYPPIKDSLSTFDFINLKKYGKNSKEPSLKYTKDFKKWKVETAIGGGPVLVQNGVVAVSNNEELKFTGKAINDKHPRTSIGYTKRGKLIVMVIQGRSADAVGATLLQEAQLFKELDCYEAINLDGGGSSCMLINGRETIRPSDKEGERPVPGVFIIKTK